MPSYTISGRVVGTDGAPIVNASVIIYEVLDLIGAPRQKGSTVLTDSYGRYSSSWAESTSPAFPWDLFVRASDGQTTVDSPLINDLADTATIDLILGEGIYTGRSEWERVAAKIAPHIGSTQAKDIPVDRLEWLARRADVFPTHLAAYVQAHRLANGHSVKPETCYACLRAGLPADLFGLVQAGAPAWENALREAWARILLPLPGDGSQAALDQEVTSEITALNELVIDAAVASPVSGVNQRVILDTLGLDPNTEQRVFAQLWRDHTGPVGDFWDAVANSSISAHTDVLKFTVQAATLVGAHVQTLEALQAERVATNISTIADTAAWSTTDWYNSLTNALPTGPVAPPPEIPGADDTAKRQNYARVLFNILESAYPSASLRAAIVRDEQALSAPPNSGFVATFLTNNPGFNIVESTLGNYLAGAVSPWTGIDPADQAQARANLETVQRVYRLTPPIGRYATAKVLLEQGITSATQVVESTRSEFVAQFSALMPSDDHDAEALAGAVWDNAAKINSLVIGLSSQLALAKTNADFVPVAMPGSEQFENASNGLAELATILGNLDYCACEHCRSVFSPAAYLADLLGFLQKRPAEQAANALAVLLARRPDIEHILLDCANTNTPLPYIDLVNELLEDFINGGLGATSKQTTWTADELRLHPEHLDTAVYEGTTLTQTVHPWTLPFSLPTVEARTYLHHLGIPRHELMRRAAPVSPSEAFLDEMAADVLGLGAVEFQIVAGLYGGNTSADDREYWGFSSGAESDNWVNILNGTDPAGNVGEILSRARLELSELRELIELDFVNPSGNITFQWAETCELDDATIAFLDDAALDRIHRFLRLRRATKIPARMLNVLIQDALGGVLDRTSLRSLANIIRVRDRLRLDWDVLTTFWADVIDARNYENEPRALYTRRFLGKDFGAVDPDFAPTGAALFGETSPATAITAGQLPRVLAGLGIREQDYGHLSTSDLGSTDFSFANFTALFRAVVLARALKLSIAELARLAGTNGGLTGLDPFASPAATLAFIDQIEAIRTSGFSVNEIDWLLRHEFVGPDPLDEATIGRSLAALARGLNTIEAEAALLVDPDGQALEKNLGQLLDAIDVTTAIEIVDKTTALPPAEQDTFIDLKFVGVLDTQAAKNVLVADPHPDRLEQVSDRRAWLLGKIVGHLRRRALVFDTAANQFRIPATVAEALLTSVLTDPAGSSPLFEVFRLPFATEDEIAAELTPAMHANEFAAWTRLAKAALVCERFGLRADQVAWYSGHASWLDLDTLPLDAVGLDASFSAWEGLRRALALRDLSRPGELAPAEIAQTSTLSAAIEILADHAGWDATAVLGLATSLGYGDSDAAAVAEEVIPERLRILVETADRLGVALDVLVSWATEAPTMVQTAEIKSATRAKYGEDRWPRVGKPLRDAIRERQRDALVDAVISISPASTPDEVFEHLLIDVEMSPCMMTSRIKQAIASVQIFIHRVLLHLEDDEVLFDPEAIQRWNWMKNYRVWEANRKVFLYPENWIEPELRADKTPEFEELEAGLMQGELDQRRVEKALGAYLETLARVANLEIIGVYEQPVTRELWLLARTQASPHDWFVRRRLPSGVWEAWEAVPNGIDSDAAVIVLSKGRLHVFWATREQIAISETALKYRFRVSHMERSSEGWGKPTVSKPSEAESLPEHDYRLHYYDLESGRIMLSVLWHNPHINAAYVGVAASFAFETIERRVDQVNEWMGDHLTVQHVPVGASSSELSVLKSSGYVALQNQYRFDGQRSVNNSAIQGDEGADVNLLAAYIKQGSLGVHLFDAPSVGRKSTFVYHANVFTPYKSPELYPLVYDDRVRKYLIEPGFAFALDDPNPAYVGHFDLAPYVTCPPVAGLQPTASTSRERATQKLRDGLVEQRPWSTAAPGQNPALVSVGLVENPESPSYVNSLLLADSKQVAQANLDLGVEHEDYPADPQGYALDMVALYHPFVRDMQEALATGGLLGLYAPPPWSPLFRQLKSADPFGVEDMGLNTDVVHGELPIEEFDFDFDSPYATYNWELFYHVPMLIAKKLTTEQRFEAAQNWYHVMFNPIHLVKLPGETVTTKFWRIKPFYEQASILAKDQFEVMLGIGVSSDEQTAATEAFAKQVAAWEANPFDPHAVARVRPGVYQRALLRGYFDNLIAWADNLFRRDTIESITEATVLYVVIAQLLGPRPQEVPGPEGLAKSFAELSAGGLDAFSNAMIELESWIHLPTQPIKKQGCGESAPAEPWARVPVVSHFWYFCYPPNPELLKYWDIVADRLFKIRHCQNIDGVERQLPLFEPPIDPALLVQATAAGVDIRSVLAELDSGLPPYRFRSVHGRATAFANSLRSLGASLLSALEKRDSEELSRIRSDQELEMLARVRDVRLEQVEEVRTAIESLEAAREVIFQRETHYLQLMQGGLSREEREQFDSGEKAQQKRSAAQGLQLAASISSAIPQLSVFPPDATFGGLQLSNVLNAIASGFMYQAAEHDYKAGRAGMTAGFARRHQDWSLQYGQAELEVARINKDIAAAKIRLAIAERELGNHDQQTEHARAVDEYMRSKFTNRELYDWMIGQLSTLYFQTYQLAFDLAKRAERAYRHELAIPDGEPPIIKFGYWDSLRKGLLAGERLGHDLERLDLAYMDRDIREFELRKSISLAELNPVQLQELRENASCTFELPEVLFDLDHPGHYLRRIRSVRVTIPAVVGPYTTLGASLKLDTHKTRTSKDSSSYAEDPVNGDDRFRYGTGAGQMIATSTAMSDGGLFNLDFRDERYLPFEYAGAISKWTLELPNQVRQFDYRTIEDVVIHIDYTARQGGEQLRNAAESSLATQFNAILNDVSEPFALLLSVHDAFPNEWEQFFTVQSGNHILTLPVEAQHFPYFAQRRGFDVDQVDLVLLLAPSVSNVANFGSTLDIHVGSVNFTQSGSTMWASYAADTPADPSTMTLTVANNVVPAALLDSGDLDPTKVVGMAMVVRYTLTP